jgi:hypothetical protein
MVRLNENHIDIVQDPTKILKKKQVFGSKKSSKNDKWINKNPRFFKIQQKILQKITSRSQPLLRW